MTSDRVLGRRFQSAYKLSLCLRGKMDFSLGGPASGSFRRLQWDGFISLHNLMTLFVSAYVSPYICHTRPNFRENSVIDLPTIYCALLLDDGFEV